MLFPFERYDTTDGKKGEHLFCAIDARFLGAKVNNVKRGTPPIDGLPRSAVARAAGLEPTTYGLEDLG
jgi:hypothetical protein